MSGSRPLVSIVLPAFVRTAREADLLDETLGTVDAQTCREYEVVVVDDGSPRDIAQVVAAHPRTTLIRQRNAGPAAARNRGIDAAHAEHVVFLDADDHLLPCALETGVHHLEQHPDCGWAVGPREEMTYEGQPVPWEVGLPQPATDPWDLYLALLRFDWYIIPPSSAIFRMRAVRTIGGFQDPWGADDLDFYLRMARAFPAWCYASPAVTRYRRYSESSSRDGARMLRSVRAVYARQWPVIRGSVEAEAAYRRGLDWLTGIFTDCLVENIRDRVRTRRWLAAASSARLLARESPHKLAATVLAAVRGSGGTPRHT